MKNARLLSLLLTLVFVIGSLGYVNTTSAAKPDCENDPNHPSCKDDGGGGGGGNKNMIFDVVLIGHASEFPGGLPAPDACGSSFATVFIRGDPDNSLYDLYPGGLDVLIDQVFGIGTGSLKSNGDVAGIHFLAGRHGVGGSNEVFLSGADDICGTADDLTTVHADVGLQLDRDTECDGDGRECAYVTGFITGTNLSSEAYVRCTDAVLSPPQILYLIGESTINLFHRCTVWHSNGTEYGLLSWGQLVLNAR